MSNEQQPVMRGYGEVPVENISVTISEQGMVILHINATSYVMPHNVASRIGSVLTRVSDCAPYVQNANETIYTALKKQAGHE